MVLKIKYFQLLYYFYCDFTLGGCISPVMSNAICGVAVTHLSLELA